MTQANAKYIIITGIIITVCGTLIYFFNDYLKWLGKLPGDIRIERKNFHFYFPLVTMILISLLLALIFNLIKRL